MFNLVTTLYDNIAKYHSFVVFGRFLKLIFIKDRRNWQGENLQIVIFFILVHSQDLTYS